MICSWISYDNRKQRRVKNARARRAGIELAISRVTTEEIGQHIVALTLYLARPNKARLDELIALEHARHHTVHYIGSHRDASADMTDAEIEAARDMANRERVCQVLTRNLLARDLADLQFEMAVVTGLSPGGEDPIEHIVLSWPEGERPNDAQVEEALDILLTVVGMSRHQAYAVLHGDTDNWHLHVALNRIDPASGDRVQIGLNLERSLETLHQAVSIIEHRQGWMPQINALYRADENGVYDRATGTKVRDAAMHPCASSADQKRIRQHRASEKFERKISSAARDYERRTGLESLQRRVMTTAAPAIRTAKSWDEVHRRLAPEGMRYRMLKEGAVLACGDRAIAASTAWGGASAAKMVERLGPFEPASADIDVASFQDRDIPTLRAAVEKRRAREAISRAQRGLADSTGDAADMIAARYARTVANDPRSKTSALNDARSEARVELEPLRAALEKFARLQRERLRRERKRLERRNAGESETDDDLDAPKAILLGFGAATAPLLGDDAELDDDCRVVQHRDHVDYYRTSQLIFVEYRDRIDLHVTDDAALRQALRIGAAKWGSVAGIGDQRFLDRLARIAVEEGIDLTNPELQDTLQALRRERDAKSQTDSISAIPEASRVAIAPLLQSPHLTELLGDYAPQFADWIKLRDSAGTPAAELRERAVAITATPELARQLAELESQQFAFTKELRRSARAKRRLNALDILSRDEFFSDEQPAAPAEELPSFPGLKRRREELTRYVTFASGEGYEVTAPADGAQAHRARSSPGEVQGPGLRSDSEKPNDAAHHSVAPSSTYTESVTTPPSPPPPLPLPPGLDLSSQNTVDSASVHLPRVMKVERRVQVAHKEATAAAPKNKLPATNGSTVSDETALSSTALADPTPSTTPKPSIALTLVWTDSERNHQNHVDWLAARHRRRIDKDIADALADRVGRNHVLTPYAARLIERVEKGFNPDTIPSLVGPGGDTLDQRDAAEIKLLSRDPTFLSYLRAAARRDEAVSRLVEAAPHASGPDFLGRVAEAYGRIHFGPTAAAVPGSRTELRTPLELARNTLEVIRARKTPLSRERDLVGVYDDDVLRLSKYNYLGLLHKEIQDALDVERRIQVEVERDILLRVRTGELKVETTIKQDPFSREASTSVRLLTGLSDERRFVSQRSSDTAFYYRSREAVAGLPVNLPPLRHSDVTVRAWFEARDEGAAAPVVNMLAQQVRALGILPQAGMTDADAAAFEKLLKPEPVFPPITPQRGRGRGRGPGRGPRSRLPDEPGRRDPTR